MPQSHGSGEFSLDQFARLGKDIVFEKGVLVFHPENINIGDGVYIGHNTILKGYYRNTMNIGRGTWIGQQCFFHSAGGLTIGSDVGVGPGVKMITSTHSLKEIDKPILHSAVTYAPIYIGDNCDIGTGAIILPGVRIGRGVQIGAGSVVTSNIDDFSIAVGIPAKVAGLRK